MEKGSTSKDFLTKLYNSPDYAELPKKYKEMLATFYQSYAQSLEENGISFEPYEKVFHTFLDLFFQQFKSPYHFQPYHQKIRAPFDYYTFGLEFLSPLIDLKHSKSLGLEHVDEIEAYLKRKDNVILFANHQTEADPHAISILLEKTHPQVGEDMIFVAGARVTTDLMSIPFSMGCNLLCVYSKKYIDNPPEEKLNKQLHNKRTMELMNALLKEGGKCIYVAPSGGRDRPNSQGIVELDPFDTSSVEMFYLMAQKADTGSGHKTHFFPLALATYNFIPPPDTIQIELGETRIAQRGPIHLSFGPELNMETFPGCEETDKHLRRQKRTEYIFNQVNNEYSKIK